MKSRYVDSLVVFLAFTALEAAFTCYFSWTTKNFVGNAETFETCSRSCRCFSKLKFSSFSYKSVKKKAIFSVKSLKISKNYFHRKKKTEFGISVDLNFFSMFRGQQRMKKWDGNCNVYVLLTPGSFYTVFRVSSRSQTDILPPNNVFERGFISLCSNESTRCFLCF